MGGPVSILDAPRHGFGTRSTPRESAPRSLALELVMLGALVAAVALVFGYLSRDLIIRSDASWARVNPYFAPSTHPGTEAITFSGPFLAVVVGSVGLAALRHHLAAFVVFLLAACTPLAQAVLGVLGSERPPFFRVAPTSLAGWSSGLGRHSLGYLWRGFAIDYGLALLPAIAIIAWTLNPDVPRADSRFTRARASLRRPTAAEATGLALSAFLFWLFLHTWELRETLQNGGTSRIGTDLVAYLPFFLFGAVLARGSRWRFVPVAAVPVLWSAAWIPNVLAGNVHGPSMSDVHDAVPFVAVVAAGALWYPIASVVDGGRIRAWTLVAALNALNVADVLFTRAALHSGQAVEANPFAAWIGPGAKLIGVAVASALLARFRPRALVWLVLAFGALIAWHLSGLILDAT